MVEVSIYHMDILSIYLSYIITYNHGNKSFLKAKEEQLNFKYDNDDDNNDDDIYVFPFVQSGAVPTAGVPKLPDYNNKKKTKKHKHKK